MGPPRATSCAAATGPNAVSSAARTSPRVPELFIAGELLAAGGRAVVEVMLHEAAHALATRRGIKEVWPDAARALSGWRRKFLWGEPGSRAWFVTEPGEVDGAGGVEGFLRGAGREAGVQDRILVAVVGCGVDREAERMG